MDIKNNGWVTQINNIKSPNFDDRPADTTIDLLVIHSISLPKGKYGGTAIDELFTNSLASHYEFYEDLKDLRVSAHFLIKRDGAITQYVSILDRAWHAGVSNFKGRAKCNDFSIGIELEGTDDSEFTEEQYKSLNELIKIIRKFYPKITADRIVGHSDIAQSRKSDPGSGFKWARIVE